MNIPMTPMEATGWTIAALVLILALWFFYSFIIYPKQHEKIKHKQEAKERAESDRIFKQTISEIFEDGEKSFAQTELMATSL